MYDITQYLNNYDLELLQTLYNLKKSYETTHDKEYNELLRVRLNEFLTSIKSLLCSRKITEKEFFECKKWLFDNFYL